MAFPSTVKVGTDLVDVLRIDELLRGKVDLQQSLFSQEEIRYSNRKFYPFQHLAARYAAKEALFKALGTGLSGDMDWLDVEVRRERSGKPVLHLSGKTAETADSMGVSRCMVSMSHTREYAIAFVLLVCKKQMENGE